MNPVRMSCVILYFIFFSTQLLLASPKGGILKIGLEHRQRPELFAVVLPEVQTDTIHTLSLYTIHGRKVYQETQKVHDHKFVSSDLSRRIALLPLGIYFYKIEPVGLRTSLLPLQDMGFKESLLFENISDTNLPADSTYGGLTKSGDLNGDKALDFVIAHNYDRSQPNILINNGDGCFDFAPKDCIPIDRFSTTDLELFDADSDGDLDLFFTAVDTATFASSSKISNRLLFNDGSGRFTDVSDTNLPNIETICYNVTSGFINQDSFPDLVITGELSYQEPYRSLLFVLINNGKGKFSDQSSIFLPEKLTYGVFDVAISDINQDNRADILLANCRSTIISEDSPEPIFTFSGQDAILVQNEENRFVDETLTHMPPEPENDGSFLVLTADINNDNAPEIFYISIFWITENKKVCTLYINDRNGNFEQASTEYLDLPETTWINDICLADFDNNGSTDLFMTNINPMSESGLSPDFLYLNENGCFYNASDRMPDNFDFSVSASSLDMDSDGDADLFVSNSTHIVGGMAKNLLLENLTIETGVKRNQLTPEGYILFQNYPNPFNPHTEICYSLLQTGPVSLKVFDIVGREVTTLVQEVQNVGLHRVSFSGAGLPSGVYFYQLRCGTEVQVKKMLLLQ